MEVAARRTVRSLRGCARPGVGGASPPSVAARNGYALAGVEPHRAPPPPTAGNHGADAQQRRRARGYDARPRRLPGGRVGRHARARAARSRALAPDPLSQLALWARPGRTRRDPLRRQGAPFPAGGGRASGRFRLLDAAHLRPPAGLYRQAASSSSRGQTRPIGHPSIEQCSLQGMFNPASISLLAALACTFCVTLPRPTH